MKSFRHKGLCLFIFATFFLATGCGLLDSAKNAGENKRNAQKNEARGEE